MSEELTLIDAAKAGSVGAFTELVGRYRDGLLRFLITRCSSVADAEDALQDTMINAYRYLKSYDPRWRFSTWLYRIAIRNAAKQRRDSYAGVDDIADEESDPLEMCIDASERENLWVTAKRLFNDDVYTALWLRYVEDMSINDVAAALERSGSWTKVNLMRARKALDAELNTPGAQSEAYG